MERVAWILSGASGFLAVALGAFGAHGLAPVFARAGDAAKRLEWWQTASHYHLVHALALGLCAFLLSRAPDRVASVAVYAFAAGIVFFSGSLYAMALTGVRALGAVTPIGGLMFLVGWACIFVSGLRFARG